MSLFVYNLKESNPTQASVILAMNNDLDFIGLCKKHYKEHATTRFINYVSFKQWFDTYVVDYADEIMRLIEAFKKGNKFVFASTLGSKCQLWYINEKGYNKFMVAPIASKTRSGYLCWDDIYHIDRWINALTGVSFNIDSTI